MASKRSGGLGSAGDSAGRAVGGAVDFVSKAGARTREEAEDIWADARDVARRPSGRDAAVYTGLAATAVLGVVELPIAAAVGAGYALLRRRR